MCATILDFTMSYGCPIVMYTKDLLLYDNSGNKVISQKPKWRPVEHLTTLISNFFQLYLKLSFSCFPKKFDFSLYFQQFNLNLLKEWWFPLLHYIILTPFCFCVLLLCKKKHIYLTWVWILTVWLLWKEKIMKQKQTVIFIVRLYSQLQLYTIQSHGWQIMMILYMYKPRLA